MFRYIDALIFFCALTSTLKVNFSRSVLRSTEDVELLENDIKGEYKLNRILDLQKSNK